MIKLSFKNNQEFKLIFQIISTFFFSKCTIHPSLSLPLMGDTSSGSPDFPDSQNWTIVISGFAKLSTLYLVKIKLFENCTSWGHKIYFFCGDNTQYHWNISKSSLKVRRIIGRLQGLLVRNLITDVLTLGAIKSVFYTSCSHHSVSQFEYYAS